MRNVLPSFDLRPPCTYYALAQMIKFLRCTSVPDWGYPRVRARQITQTRAIPGGNIRLGFYAASKITMGGILCRDLGYLTVPYLIRLAY